MYNKYAIDRKKSKKSITFYNSMQRTLFFSWSYLVNFFLDSFSLDVFLQEQHDGLDVQRRNVSNFWSERSLPGFWWGSFCSNFSFFVMICNPYLCFIWIPVILHPSSVHWGFVICHFWTKVLLCSKRAFTSLIFILRNGPDQ